MPSIYESMENPKMYDRMVDFTWLILGAVYMGMAALGYLMYGDETQDQVCRVNHKSVLIGSICRQILHMF